MPGTTPSRTRRAALARTTRTPPCRCPVRATRDTAPAARRRPCRSAAPPR
ncbi:hypothetical protein BAE44_0006701 [Dichanthelium oligosanthes]|uniref:Uncharacterized protein n=1 Tax=Dichanthelium oligosanthes TaxID=888268 RepID=A0A1E5W4V1_9POAL|nr:hypothetical protein BAE44_0006701 [Dichanthelium oligosanthes]